jgi:methylenetetrahydrofolate dehydrogenase (NADP+)/methenyltetrahydrofolate cyclohydrolase
MGFSNVYGVPGFTSTAGRRAEIIDGKAIATELRGQVAAEVEVRVAEGLPVPGLATILVGDDPGSAVYVGAKHRACAEAGIESIEHRLPADCSPQRLMELILACNEDAGVSGILLQLPLPGGLDPGPFVEAIDPGKDVDGLSGASVGALWRSRPGLAPCTPSGVMELLRRSGIELRGAEATIVGRSELVGRPLAAMLLAADATVTICHSKTRNLAAQCARADVLIAALGRPKAIGRAHIKVGAAVIDVGINRTHEGLVGDVDFDKAVSVAGAITPVPGGVGPMTIACLMRNTLEAAVAATDRLAGPVDDSTRGGE